MAYSGRGKKNSFDGFENDNIDESAHNKWFAEITAEMHRITKENGSAYTFIDFRNYARIYNIITLKYVIKNCIVWDKGSIGMGHCFRFQHEFIIYAQKGKPLLYMAKKNISDIWKVRRDVTIQYEHPTQKPMAIMYKPIEYSSKEGDVVFDPFIGSGTTAVACERLGRKWFGCEISPEYCKIAEERIKREKDQLKLSI